MAMHAVIDKSAIESFCIENKIQKLMLFGSVLRDDFTPDSDIDVLVEFQQGASVGLMKLSRMERELSALLGRRVDLNTAGFLSPYFKDEVLKEAQAQYVAP